MKKISIIVPCHNSAKYLPDCLKSIRNQSIGMENLECIFVDDASTDEGETLKMLMEFEAQFPESVVVIPLEENLRQGGARNVALKYVSGEYIFCLDSDDMLTPDACERVYETATEQDADLVLIGKEDIIGDISFDDAPIPDNTDSRISVVDFGKEPETRKMYLVGARGSFGCWGKLYRASCVAESGASFAEHVVYEEPKFVLPQYLFINNLVEDSGKYYLYRIRPQSTMTSQVGKRILDHPKVQMELYEYLLGLGERYLKFKPELDFHFVYSFYLETLYFYAKNAGAHLPLEYFHYMQDVCKTLVPGILESRYIYTASDRAAFESIFADVKTQDELREIAGRII